MPQYRLWLCNNGGANSWKRRRDCYCKCQEWFQKQFYPFKSHAFVELSFDSN